MQNQNSGETGPSGGHRAPVSAKANNHPLNSSTNPSECILIHHNALCLITSLQNKPVHLEILFPSVVLQMKAAGLNSREREIRQKENDSPVMCSAGHGAERRSEKPAVGG